MHYLHLCICAFPHVSVAERHAERLRRQQQIEVHRHGLRLADDVLEPPRDDVGRSERDHRAELAALRPAPRPCRRSASPARDRSWSARRRAAGGRARPIASPCRSRSPAPRRPARRCRRAAPHVPACAASRSDSVAALRNAPSATTTMLNLRAPRVALAQPLGDQRDVERNLRESGSRRRRRRRRRTARSSRRSGPSPRRP